ncbi:nidogen-2-like [Xyrauchen texanus]|uniref:nidogen-2-like n=1 Tax=Xyrauchen texanus TaxID=154827 RepID=UPI0022423183|nr:nidogen-2-like [Xyrauchen texanus]
MTWDKIAVFILKLSWTVYHVAAIQRQDMYPFGMFSGDVTLQEGDDETSKVITLTKPMYFYEASFRNLYVATNGIISTQDLPMEKQYVDDGFPTDFPVIAPFLADIDTSKGKGSIYYRQTESPTVLKQVEADVMRGFSDATFTPTHAFIATWENVSAYEEDTRSSTPSNRINTFQVVLAYNEKDTYALFLYPEDGLQFFGTRPKESYNVEIELPARVGFTRGELSYFIFSRTEGPYYSVTSNDEQSLKNLYQNGNTGLPGVWLFHIGNRYSFQNVVPAQHETISVIASQVLDPEFPEKDYTETDEDEYHIDPDFQDPTTTDFLEPERDSSLLQGLNQAVPHDHSPLQPSVSGSVEFPQPEPHNLPPEDVTQPQPQRPLPKHAILQVYPNRLKGVPPHTSGGQVFSVEEKVNFDSEVIQYSTDNKETCERFQQQCSQNARCMDYSTGFCCHCNSGFYGNGHHCLPNGAPHRVNGKVRGTISVGGTLIQLDSIDLHAYIVVGDGRAYTAISEVPELLGWSLMPVSPIGGLFGWLFALELPNSFNGFSITGAEFTRRADVTFYPSNQRLSIVQTATGLDTQNYLSVDTHLQGSIPFIPPGATVQMEPFKDTYHYYPSLITSTSVHEFTVVSVENGAETFTFQVKQNITYRDCSHGPRSRLETQELRMERIFVMFVKEERILRYAITNKIGPVGARDPEPENVNPCYSGNHDCDTTAECVPGEGQVFTCQCATGYRGDGRNCYDVDECAEGLSSCGAHSQCVNLLGSHRCQCHGGFEFGYDGRTCQDVDECRDQRCHTQAMCSNTPGSFQCQCQPGFHGDGFQCYPNGGRPKTQCEQHRDSLQGGTGGVPLIGAFIPQCDDEGQYRPLQCHGSTGHCWCVDSRGQERDGTRTPPGTPPRNCDEPVRPKTQCEQHRDSLQGGTGGIPQIGAFIPQCDEEGQYRPLQCHGSTGHCWCVDSRGQERVGTRMPPGTPPRNCDEPVPPTQRSETVCERWRASLLQHYGGQPDSQHYLPQCDSGGEFNPVQCYGDSSYCWCVDRDGREVPGTRSHDTVKPACIPTVAPPTTHPLPRPDVTPPPTGTSLLYAQGQQIGVLPLNGTLMDKQRSSVLLALHGSIVVGIDYDCRERKVYWTDLAGRTINRAGLEPKSEPEIVINTGLTSPEGLAVDVARRRLFWVDSTPDKIETSNLDGSNRRVLFETDLVNPRAIIVDSPTGTLYWTDWNREAPKIESSSVDGQNRRVLVRDGIGLPNALTYDSTTRQVCWADAGTKRLECISPNGTGRRVVHSNLNYPFSMVSYASHYYYTDWRRDGVITLGRDSQFTDEYLPDQRSHLYGITVAPQHCL